MGRMGALLFGVVCIGLAGSLLVACNRKREVDENLFSRCRNSLKVKALPRMGQKNWN